MIKHNIPYFNVGKTPGGNQDWFKDWWMNVGGCAALAACDTCICLAKNHGQKKCCPFSPEHITVSQYVEFGMTMKPFIRPRVGGVTKLSDFTKGCGKYLEKQGILAEFKLCPGEKTYEEAEKFLVDTLQKNMPVAFLLLKHKSEECKELIWHWFMITGYEKKDGKLTAIYHTYGNTNKIEFATLWNTGFHKKGGMVAIDYVRTIFSDNLPEDE